MTHVPIEMVDAARSARASLRLQRSVSTCFTKRPWQVPRELHPAELVLEAIPSFDRGTRENWKQGLELNQRTRLMRPGGCRISLQ